jgi:hypothetical protein
MLLIDQKVAQILKIFNLWMKFAKPIDIQQRFWRTIEINFGERGHLVWSGVPLEHAARAAFDHWPRLIPLRPHSRF